MGAPTVHQRQERTGARLRHARLLPPFVLWLWINTEDMEAQGRQWWHPDQALQLSAIEIMGAEGGENL